MSIRTTLIGAACGMALLTGILFVAVEDGSADTSKTCTYQKKSYKHGATVCRKDGFKHECNGRTGQWVNLKQKC